MTGLRNIENGFNSVYVCQLFLRNYHFLIRVEQMSCPNRLISLDYMVDKDLDLDEKKTFKFHMWLPFSISPWRLLQKLPSMTAIFVPAIYWDQNGIEQRRNVLNMLPLTVVFDSFLTRFLSSVHQRINTLEIDRSYLDSIMDESLHFSQKLATPRHFEKLKAFHMPCISASTNGHPWANSWHWCEGYTL